MKMVRMDMRWSCDVCNTSYPKGEAFLEIHDVYDIGRQHVCIKCLKRFVSEWNEVCDYGEHHATIHLKS